MILQRFAAAAILALTVLVYGCSSTQQTTVAPAPPPVAADLPATRVDASRPTVDPRILPAPREPVAGTPDLDSAAFEVTDTNLRAMTGAGLPQAQANSLNALKGRSFGNVTEFRAAVEDRIGKPAAQAHMGTILRSALAVKLADAPEVPEGKAELLAAESQKRPAAQVQTAAPVAGIVAGTMGSGKFKPLFFDLNKSAVKKDFGEALTFNAGVLKGDKTLKAVIEGHCDERGSPEYNMALGRRRAEAVRAALVAEGVAAEQLKTLSYGAGRPVDPGHDEAAWSKNRRVIINLQ